MRPPAVLSGSIRQDGQGFGPWLLERLAGLAPCR